MPFYSMTGFGKAETKNKKYHIIVEIKSVNNRFKDFKFKFNNNFIELETKLREILNKSFKRGSFETHIFFKEISKKTFLKMNLVLYI